MTDSQELETIGRAILDVSFDLHTQFGSGLLERAYRVLLSSELRRQGHKVEEEKTCDIDYRDVHYENMFRSLGRFAAFANFARGTFCPNLFYGLRAGDTPESVEKMISLGLDYIPTNVTVPMSK